MQKETEADWVSKAVWALQFMHSRGILQFLAPAKVILAEEDAEREVGWRWG